MKRLTYVEKYTKNAYREQVYLNKRRTEVKNNFDERKTLVELPKQKSRRKFESGLAVDWILEIRRDDVESIEKQYVRFLKKKKSVLVSFHIC